MKNLHQIIFLGQFIFSSNLRKLFQVDSFLTDIFGSSWMPIFPGVFSW